MKSKTRDEKTCLNCGTEVSDKYCPHCGQENRDPKESIGELLHHFFSDITHYDSKFFKTIKDLLFRPGFLTLEYLAGRRMRYLNPVRLYVFISFLFFLLYFTFFSSRVIIRDDKFMTHTQLAKTDSLINHFRDSVLNADTKDFGKSIHGIQQYRKNLHQPNINLLSFSSDFRTVAEFDSAQHALPVGKRMGWVPRFIARKWVGMEQEYGNQRINVLAEDFRHNIPKMMFLLLPIFALLLKWFYSRKKYNYVDHAIFTIHFHSFIFLLLLIGMIFDGIFRTSFFSGIQWILIFLYLVIAQKNTYHQSYLKSFLKSFAIVFFYSIGLTICLIGTAILTFISV
ncbi:MAG TPA: DUF3667 domain-containing protein [Chitinophagaceae bacterium]|nr:DUF3667 domain-containing protein [Chitinophagaceae bacterium]